MFRGTVAFRANLTTALVRRLYDRSFERKEQRFSQIAGGYLAVRRSAFGSFSAPTEPAFGHREGRQRCRVTGKGRRLEENPRAFTAFLRSLSHQFFEPGGHSVGSLAQEKSIRANGNEHAAEFEVTLHQPFIAHKDAGGFARGSDLPD